MVTLSVVIPCYNEEETLSTCVERVLAIASSDLQLEIVIVDDSSRDASLEVARGLEETHPCVKVLAHEQNQGKGAALRTGFVAVTGDFVAVQDADLEYDPQDLVRLVEPLAAGYADVVLGSRFRSGNVHRVLYFWHSMGNRFLTFLSNMFTDLNLTDMETCYKLFRREVIQSVEIRENRFGFEPEIVAKIAHQRLRIYEMGISYQGRTYDEGKKIGWRDGFRALYCIMKYNAHHAPVPIQFLVYLLIGGTAAVFNLALFMAMFGSGVSVEVAVLVAFFAAAVLNYWLCVLVLFRRNARWRTPTELGLYVLVVCCIAGVDLFITRGLIWTGASAVGAKIVATLTGLVLNFSARKWLVFPEPASGPWQPGQRR